MTSPSPPRSLRRCSATLAAAVLPLAVALSGAAPTTAYAALSCGSGVPHDVNGDGYAEVAVFDGSTDNRGAVHVLYGSPKGLTAVPTGSALDDQYFTLDTPGVPGSGENGGSFGEGLTFGDFNADGCADLAIGTGFYADVPRVVVLYGSPGGLTTTGVRTYTDADVGITGSKTNLGPSLVAADLDDDGVEDLAMGASGATVADEDFAGVVVVVNGSSSGLSATPSAVLTRNTPGVPGAAGYGEAFGHSLASGDFDGDGITELAISAPFGRNGLIQTVEGGPAGHGSPQPQPLSLATPGLPKLKEQYAEFGVVIAAGDVQADGRADLAVGAFQVPCRHPDDEECDYSPGNGTVLLFPGTTAGLSGAGSQAWTQDSPGVAGSGSYELFGSALAMGHLDDGPTDDLAIGARYDNLGKARDAGSVSVLLGSANGLTTAGAGGALFHQGVAGISGSNENDDNFGAALQIANVQGRARSNLIISSPGEAVGSTARAGQMLQLASGAGGPKARGTRALNAGSTGVRGPVTEVAYFGSVLG